MTTIQPVTKFHEHLPVNAIDHNKRFVRFEEATDKDAFKKSLIGLASSIKEVGLLQPIVVLRKEDEKRGEYFEVRAGDRRLAACRDILKWETIPATVYYNETPMLSFVENVQRDELTPLEKGRWLSELVNVMQTENPSMKKQDIMAELAKQSGKSPRTLYDMIRADAEATPEQREAMKAGTTSAAAVATEIKKKKAKKRQQNKGQSVSRAKKGFSRAVDDMKERLGFIGVNAIEFKQDKSFMAVFNKLVKFIEVTADKLEEASEETK